MTQRALPGISEHCRVRRVRPPKGVGHELLSEACSQPEHGPEIRVGVGGS